MSTVDMRTGEIIEDPSPSVDLALLSPSELDATADPGAFVVLACERAKTWLTEALDKGDIESVVELKSQAEAIRVYTVQKQLGHDAQVAATEIVRRAERGIGLCIRKGQAEGRIASKSNPGGGPRSPYVRVRAGVEEHIEPAVRDKDAMSSPREFFGTSDEWSDSYAVSNVSDEQFETALTEAKAEGNLSRANVVRKCKGEQPKPAGRPEHLRKTRHHDANRIIAEIVNGLEGYCMTLGLIDFEQIQPENVAGWSDSLSKSLRSLNRLNAQLKKENQP